MEAIAALAFVCNIGQLIEYAIAVANTIKQHRQAGSSDDDIDLDSQSQRLQTLAGELRKDQKSGTNAQSSNSINRQIYDIAESCEKITARLRAELGNLKSDGSLRGALIVVTRALRKRNEIDKLKAKLQNHREVLTSTIVVALFKQMQDHNVLQKGQYDALDQNLKLWRKDADSAFTDLKALVDSFRNEISTSHARLEQSVQAQFYDLRIHTDTTTQNRTLLDSLTFPEMNYRLNQIDDNEPGTFEWIFDPTINNDHTTQRPRFDRWLKSDTNFFWIQGKPGSGKSTLMRFLWKNPATPNAIQQTHGSDHCIVLRYAFWLAGNDIQKSLRGCYLVLIYQLLSSLNLTLSAMLAASPDILQKRQYSDWPVKELESLLLAAVKHAVGTTSLVIFVDGLDEIRSRHEYDPMVRTLRYLSALPRVKICASSRPESYWRDQFQSEEQLRVQDLVVADIRLYVSARLRDSNRLQTISESDLEDIIFTVADRAEGVFLWVRLAIGSVLQAIDGGTSTNEILDVVSNMPQGIADLYESMLSKRAEGTVKIRQEAAVYFKACFFWGNVFLLDCVGLKAEFDRQDMVKGNTTLNQVHQTYEMLQTRIPHICGGMLECIDVYPAKDEIDGAILYTASRGRHNHYLRVTFIHRTVADFLLDFKAGQQLLAECPLTNDELLQASVRACLQDYFLHEQTLTKRRLIRLIDDILHKSTALVTSSEGIVQAIHLLECAIAIPRARDDAVDTSLGAFRTKFGSLSLHDQFNFFSTAPSAQSLTDSCQRTLWEEAYFYPTDMLGYTLSCGLSHYADCLMEPEPGGLLPSGTRFTQVYKDYLLLCACIGLEKSTDCAKIISVLIDSGANPFTDFFLPVSQPARVCAATYLLCYTYYLLADYDDRQSKAHKVSIAAPLLKKVVLVASMNEMSRSKRATITFQPKFGWLLIEVPFPIATGNSMEEGAFLYNATLYPLLEGMAQQLERPTASLEFFIQELRSQDDCIALAMVGETHLLEGIIITGITQASAPFATLSTAIAAELMEEYNQLLSIGDWRANIKSHNILNEKLTQLYFSDSTTKVDSSQWLRDCGYSVDKNDPRVFKGPIPQFEPIEPRSGDEKEALDLMKVPEAVDTTPDSDSDTSGTDSIFHDAQE